MHSKINIQPCTHELDENVYLQGEGEGFEAEFLWFYEGRNGWWAYDQRTSIEIENHQKVNATFVYLIHFILCSDHIAQFVRMLGLIWCINCR